MSELDKTLEDNLNNISVDVIEAYLKERKAPKCVVGRLYHYWDSDKEAGLTRVAPLQAINPSGGEYLYVLAGMRWIHIQAPIDFPDIYIPFEGDKCPEAIKDKRVTLWFSDGDVGEYSQAKKTPHEFWNSKRNDLCIIAYLVHGDS